MAGSLPRRRSICGVPKIIGARLPAPAAAQHRNLGRGRREGRSAIAISVALRRACARYRSLGGRRSAVGDFRATILRLRLRSEALHRLKSEARETDRRSIRRRERRPTYASPKTRFGDFSPIVNNASIYRRKRHRSPSAAARSLEEAYVRLAMATATADVCVRALRTACDAIFPIDCF